MARPTVLHKGFLIPNAADVASPQMAEPDRIDFNTLGNARFGVIEGCEITVSGTTAMNTAGTAIVNGALVTMAGGQSADLGAAGTQDRYDLLVVNPSGTGGLLKVVPGTAAADPVYPDPPTNATVLAAVFCPAGAGSLVDNVIDKRKMLSDALLTKIGAAAPLVSNRNGTGDLFKIDGSGTTVWAGDTYLRRTSAKTLSVSENLSLDGDLTVGDAINANTVTVNGRVNAANLRQSAGPPGGTSTPGYLYQRTDTGQIYTYTGSGWKELATVESAIPVGTVITSLVAPAAIGAGWVPLDGQTVINESVNASLFNIPALASYINPGGSVGSRQMTMPNATQRMLMGDFLTAGTRGGGLNGKNQFSIDLLNMPVHKHDAAVLQGGGVTLNARTGPAGRHGHNTVPGSGKHGHDVIDPGHVHVGSSTFGGAFVGLVWGGQNKIDAYFNDRSHTFSVDAVLGTMPAFTGISIGQAGSEHVHVTEPVDDHTHPVTIDKIDPHDHPLTESLKGGGQPINYTPMFLSVYVYIRQ